MKLDSVHIPEDAHGVDQGGAEPFGGEPQPDQDALDVARSCHANN